MDILVPDSWLRDYLKTSAKPQKIAEYLSLCGPSIEKVEKVDNDHVYHIEVTTNRVDSASVVGIAREAAAILQRFKVQATLKELKPLTVNKNSTNEVPLKIKCEIPEVRRVMAVVINGVSSQPSPKWLKQRLELCGLRSLNILIDITNYIMLETGHPTHVFDYDRIKSHELIFRKSDKGEKIKTLENKVYSLPGDDIVIDDGEGEIIDLPGIIGTANSIVTPNTKRIIFFIDNNDPVYMRRTSMSLGLRTTAVTINEKDVDPELASIAFARGVELYEKLAKGKVVSKIVDIYPNPYKGKKIKTSYEFIIKRLGINLEKKEISKILESLGFATKWINDNLEVSIPSYRAQDVDIAEGIVEEATRIYGYHNLPSELMTGKIPHPLPEAPFDFEQKVKRILKGFGAIEVYTLSLTSRANASLGVEPLKLKNPLGTDTEYLRTTLRHSLVNAAKENSRQKQPFHLFEVSNVYLPKVGELPEERMTLAGIFANYEYQNAKGAIEALLEELNCVVSYGAEDIELIIKSDGKQIGELAKINASDYIYYEFDMELLREASSEFVSYKPIPKYPAQVEDLSLLMPERTLVGKVFEEIYKSDTRIHSVQLIDVYEDAKTIRVTYLDKTKTLTDKEVAGIRNKILKALNQKFGARIK